MKEVNKNLWKPGENNLYDRNILKIYNTNMDAAVFNNNVIMLQTSNSYWKNEKEKIQRCTRHWQSTNECCKKVTKNFGLKKTIHQLSILQKDA